MPDDLEFAARVLLIGVGATALSDIWAWFAERAFGLPRADWGRVGRWVGHFRQRKFFHDNIAAAGPIPGERAIGWIVHYAIGSLFAGLLLAICGLQWARSPTVAPALIFGLVTVAAPFFIMQPAMGAGIAGSRMPNPATARMRSLAAHLIFGISLYLAALMTSLLLER